MAIDHVSSVKTPGTRLVAGRGETTVVVTPNDAVEIYSGGEKDRLKLLAFNPRSGWAHFEEEGKEPVDGRLEELEKKTEVHDLLDEGEAILSSRHYALPQDEGEKLRDWLAGLWSREDIPREKMWKNGTEGALVAQIWKFPALGARPDQRQTMRVECERLGKFVDTDPDNWNQCFFESRVDPSLGGGINFSEEEETGRIDVSVPRSGSQTMVGTFASVVPITEKEAEWLSSLAPAPLRRYLNVHRNFLRFQALREEEEWGRSCANLLSSGNSLGGVAI